MVRTLLDPPATKLTPPRVHTTVVSRPRLFDALDDATGRASLTLVLGYAGAGKSVLLSSWSATATTSQIAWLSCDETDAEPLRFWPALIAAVRRVEPSVGADTLDQIELDGVVSIDVIGLLSDELRAVTTPLVIVIDDLHDAADDRLWPLLSAFVEWLPEQHALIVASRSEPPLPLPRWRVEGRLAEIRNAALAFDDAEATGLLAGLGVDVEPDTATLLTRRTEGWAAGLQLAGLSVRNREDPGSYLLDVAATDRDIVDYLTAEVLDRQPADVTDFLLATSILRELDARVCGAITDDPDPQARLRDIEMRELFLVPLDRHRHAYRYHHLFAELLRERLFRDDEPRALRLHSAAADWYEKEGNLELAVFHSVSARSPARAVEMMRGRLVRSYFAGTPIRPTRLIDLIDDDTLDRERELALEFTLSIGMNGALDEAGRWIERLVRLTDAQTDATFRGRLAAARAFWEMARGGAERALSHTQTARELLDPADDISRELVIAETRVRHYLDDLDGVRQIVQTDPARGLPPMASVIVLGAHGGIEGDAGFLHTADELGRAALAVADEMGTRQHFAAGEALRVVAAVHLERLELDEAETMLEQALRTVERERPGIELLCLVDQTWLLHERRGLDDAFETIARAEALAERVSASAALIARVTSTQARLHLLVGDLDRASEALARTPAGTRRSLIEARLALAQDRPDVVGPILADIDTRNWPRHELEVALVRAHASVAADRPAAVIDREVESALLLAEQHSFIRTVALEDGVLRDVLVRSLRHSPAGSHRGTLRHHLRTRVPLPKAAEVVRGPLAPSARELEILRYLATLMSYREIAAELFISRNTMKTHVRSLYRRLGVSSRSQAVTEGRARGLI
jgi:LuxR family maltose regulon positive regulatory protein